MSIILKNSQWHLLFKQKFNFYTKNFGFLMILIKSEMAFWCQYVSGFFLLIDGSQEYILSDAR